ncbi:MAG TPA: hypothetical protein DCZ01_00220 [Elusimicrobia bacterium]|nr:MAG: hypothetical protein A2X37_08545 [Elusimicrobia bacterium GWA2_66_18]OGR69760.1 MAG: hypothetical protein A2X40_10035 [Elusimicrobia bacterium GWC2_65_9]HAZ06958.1 hypothetical protein [Elusimicrobiota bacterium]
MDKTGALSEPQQRPAWLKNTPDVELDIMDAVAGDSFFLAIIKGMYELAPGRVMRIRTDFEPTLLYSILLESGFEFWPERGENGDWNLQLCRRPRAY